MIGDIISADYYTESRYSLVVRPLYKGSMKDSLHNTKPRKIYSAKYSRPARPMSNGSILRYGKQILACLAYMQDNGIYLTHIHTGNIFIERDTALYSLVRFVYFRITDYENSFLGVETINERLFRQFAKRFPKAFRRCEVSVLAFGALMYELAVGSQLLNLSQIENYPVNASTDIAQVLHNIFLAHVDNDHEMPSLRDISESEPFAKVKTSKLLDLEPVLLFYYILQQIEFTPEEQAILKALKKNRKALHGYKKPPKRYFVIKQLTCRRNKQKQEEVAESEVSQVELEE